MKRTQIELPDDQWELLTKLGHQEGTSIAELIRRALERVYPVVRRTRFALALDQVTGMWQDRDDLGATDSHVRDLRSAGRWERLLP